MHYQYNHTGMERFPRFAYDAFTLTVDDIREFPIRLLMQFCLLLRHEMHKVKMKKLFDNYFLQSNKNKTFLF